MSRISNEQTTKANIVRVSLEKQKISRMWENLRFISQKLQTFRQKTANFSQHLWIMAQQKSSTQ